jgi:hypothetical protein
MCWPFKKRKLLEHRAHQEVTLLFLRLCVNYPLPPSPPPIQIGTRLHHYTLMFRLENCAHSTLLHYTGMCPRHLNKKWHSQKNLFRLPPWCI